MPPNQSVNTEKLVTLLNSWSARLGDNFEPYLNHACRTFLFTTEILNANVEEQEKLAFIAVFHDLGIWTDNTFDYLPPSVRLLHEALTVAGKPDWIAELSMAVEQHHKVFPYREFDARLIEGFRRGDLVDLSKRLIRFGLSTEDVERICRQFPDLGFHGRIVNMMLRRAARHPLNPLPMVKW